MISELMENGFIPSNSINRHRLVINLRFYTAGL